MSNTKLAVRASTALGLAAAAVFGAGAFAAPAPGQAKAEQDITPYERCMLDAYYGCYPNGYPPDLGNIEQAAAFEQCVAETSQRCRGLPGDPG